MKFIYLLINFLSVIVPFIFSFHPKIRFDQHFKSFFTANAIAAFCFLSWDVIFTGMGVWGFNDRYIIGAKVLNLPIEEVLFFICIPFACVFTYHCLNKFFSIKWNKRSEDLVVVLLSVFFLITGVIYINRSYTATTFISIAVLLTFFKFFFKVKWLPKLFSIYPVLLLPFFIVNGILTGSGLDQPVVWYNNSENLGIRFFTIPAEDLVYGFEMILLNLFFFELFQKRSKAKVV